VLDEREDRVMGGAGHRERASAIPDPLAPGSLLHRLSTLGLPAVTLSWVSLLAFLIVLATVQHSAALRSDYRFPVLLPHWSGGLIALGAAALAWAIAVAGSRRPGRLWPRLWALVLAVGASLIAIAALLRPAGLPTAQVDALVTASLAGALTLAPRLARIHPASDWTQRIAPLSLLATLLLILSLALIGPRAPPQTMGRSAAPGVHHLSAVIRGGEDEEPGPQDATDFRGSRMDRPLADRHGIAMRILSD